MEKKILRKLYYELFKKNQDADKKQIEKAISQNLAIFLENKKIQKVMIYEPMKTELPMVEILKEFKFNNYFPLINGDFIIPVSQETGQPEDVNNMDLIIVPGLFVTPEGYRLGRGKGYYDRLLCGYPRFKSVFVCRSWQVIDKIPVDPWDKKVGFYITENNIRQCS